MSKKPLYIAQKLHTGVITVGGIQTKMTFPERCVGILMVFETKRAARNFMGKDVTFIECDMKKENEK